MREKSFAAARTFPVHKVVTKTRNGMEKNGMERSVIFQLLTKSLDLVLGRPKLKYGERCYMASGQRFLKKMEWNSLFRSGF